VRLKLSSRWAVVLGGAAAVLAVAAPPLAAWAHEITFDELLFPLMVVPFAIVGFVLARRVPENPIGWIMLALALAAMFAADAGMYAVRAVTMHDSSLPLPRVAVFMAASWVWMVALLPLPIALFPDGRIAVRRLRWTLPLYAVVAGALVVTFVWQDATTIGEHPLKIDSSGELTVFSQQAAGWVRTDEHVLFPLYAALCVIWVVMHVVSWRGARGERRQQLKWLLAGGAVCVTGIALGVVLGDTVWADLGWAAVVALPVGVGIAILRYRLYDIDRLVSRTVSYLIVTGLLAGVFLAIVLIATRVLPFSSPVAVAASTLVAASLFNPLRRRVQHGVDRRFNRTPYDLDATVTEFRRTLRAAVDLDTVTGALETTVSGSLQPMHLTVWVKPNR
jgi:hypothetical protein